MERPVSEKTILLISSNLRSANLEKNKKDAKQIF